MDREYFDLILLIALCNCCVIGTMILTKHYLRCSSMTKREIVKRIERLTCL